MLTPSRFAGRSLVIVVAATAARLFVAGPARADEDFVDTDKACAQEITSLCKGVTPGNSQLSDCLKKNRADLSGPCKGAVNTYLKTRFEQACSGDAEKICADVRAQGLRSVMACLKNDANAEKLSPACAKVMDVKQTAPAKSAGAAKAPDAPAVKKNPLQGFYLAPKAKQ